MNKVWRVVILIGCGLLIFGCSRSDPLNVAIQGYTERLARVLEEPPPSFPTARLAPLGKREAQQELPEVSINLREFFGLRECRLSTLIAERNTVLGKTQLPSQRLHYEWQLLQALEQCAASVEQEQPATAARLRQWHQQKLRAWPQQWAYFIAHSDEVIQALSVKHGNFDEQAHGGLESIQALQFITARQTPEPWANDEMEKHLQRLQHTRFFARAWHTQMQLHQQLSVLTPWLAEQLPAVSCPAGKASQQAEILRNVFYLFFIEKIQPLAAQLNRYQYLAQPLIETWLAHSDVDPALRDWLQQHAVQNFLDYHVSMQAHVSLWQEFLARCNLSPTAPSMK